MSLTPVCWLMVFNFRIQNQLRNCTSDKTPCSPFSASVWNHWRTKYEQQGRISSTLKYPVTHMDQHLNLIVMLISLRPKTNVCMNVPIAVKTAKSSYNSTRLGAGRWRMKLLPCHLLYWQRFNASQWWKLRFAKSRRPEEHLGNIQTFVCWWFARCCEN